MCHRQFATINFFTRAVKTSGMAKRNEIIWMLGESNLISSRLLHILVGYSLCGTGFMGTDQQEKVSDQSRMRIIYFQNGII